MSVDPTPRAQAATGAPNFASRFPRKLSEAVCGSSPDTLFVCFNASGLPGSDTVASANAASTTAGDPGVPADGVRFRDKRVSRDVLDAVAVLRRLRDGAIASGGGASLLLPDAPLHVVGLSTGAIIVGLLRGLAGGRQAAIATGQQGGSCSSGLLAGCSWREERVTLTAVAGLLDVAAGVELDFDTSQRHACWGAASRQHPDRSGGGDGVDEAAGDAAAPGWCWKEFWLPAGFEHPDADLEEGEGKGVAGSGGSYKCRFQLGRQYLDEFVNGTLDVATSVGPAAAGRLARSAAVAGGGATDWAGLPTWEAGTAPPLLVIHGTADASVPLPNGLALFEAAAEPKRLFIVKGANHLLSSTPHVKKVCNEVLALVDRYRYRVKVK